ncbi:hypothetical protein Hanom_Chr12g01144061 [Helianthus anomalus]
MSPIHRHHTQNCNIQYQLIIIHSHPYITADNSNLPYNPNIPIKLTLKNKIYKYL